MMQESSFLREFIPEDRIDVEVNQDPDLVAVVQRIAILLPPDVIFSLFSSSPSATCGQSRFPYCRVDSNLIATRDWLDILQEYGARDEKDFRRIYTEATTSALKVVIWVEVGFEGLDNLAESSASVNWTSGNWRFFLDYPQQRIEGIKTFGREMYEQTLGRFVQFRDANKIEGDIFERYEVETLLDKFRSG